MLEYEKVVLIDPKEMKWAFNGGQPSYNIKQLCYDYDCHIDIDPFPCNSHNSKLLLETVTKVEGKFKIGAPTRWIVLPNDTTHYTNAYAQKNYVSGEENRKKYKFEGMIVMAGKRTIIHPAMTKYLVAHEYGHMVDYWITAMMNEKLDSTNETIFRKKYAEMRGIEYNEKYGGGNWVDNIGEIIADDFRIVVANTDKDFYLHTCTHPLEHTEVKKYWSKLKKEYSIK